MAIINNPRFTISIFFIVTLFGVFAGFSIPNSLLPKITRPEISVITSWPNNEVEVVEQTLVEPLEQQLEGLHSLREISSKISNGHAITTLVFHQDADMDKAYINVLSRVDQIRGWPQEVERPTVKNLSAGTATSLASAMLYSDSSSTDDELIQIYRKYVRPEIIKIKGVASVTTTTTPIDQRLNIVVDPQSLANYSISLREIQNNLKGLIDKSGGKITLGASDYALHFRGKVPLGELDELIVAVRDNYVVRLSDVAHVAKDVVSEWSPTSINGSHALYLVFNPTADANSLETIDTINNTFKNLNSSSLQENGFRITLSRDDSKDIKQSIKLVYSSSFLGIILAGAILLLFIRDWRVLLLIICCIPVCLSLVLQGMKIGGYTLNVISLAGIAISVGLILDSTIIVVETILRHRDHGYSLSESITKGTSGVSGALASSTASSIIVFFPIVLMESNGAELFKDLAFTISTSLVSSLLVALVLVPALARHLLAKNLVERDKGSTHSKFWLRIITFPSKNRVLAATVVFLGLPVACIVILLCSPGVDTLPSPKQRTVLAYLNFEEPLSRDAIRDKVSSIVNARIKQQVKTGEAPTFDLYGMFCRSTYCLLYFYPSEVWSFKKFSAWLNSEILADLHGVRTFTRQGNLLRLAIPDSRITSLDIRGLELPELQRIGDSLITRLRDAFPSADFSEGTPLSNQAKKVELVPHLDQLAYYGLTSYELMDQFVALTSGSYIGQFDTGIETLPLYLKGKEQVDIDSLMSTQIVVQGHGLVPLDRLASVKVSRGPEWIHRINGEVTTTIRITPPADIPIKDFTDDVKFEVNEFMSKITNKGIVVDYRGSVNQLNEFLNEFSKAFVFAVLVLILLMYFILNSWTLTFTVILSLPLALAGGILNLRLMGIFVPQALDMITMMGFIILLGLVINNAILFVQQYSRSLRLGNAKLDAIYRAIEARSRPIYMSTVTSIVGMLPLMFATGEGAEIYRGLAAVIVGGMTASAIFTLSFMASLLLLLQRREPESISSHFSEANARKGFSFGQDEQVSKSREPLDKFHRDRVK